MSLDFLTKADNVSFDDEYANSIWKMKTWKKKLKNVIMIYNDIEHHLKKANQIIAKLEQDLSKEKEIAQSSALPTTPWASVENQCFHA